MRFAQRVGWTLFLEKRFLRFGRLVMSVTKVGLDRFNFFITCLKGFLGNLRMSSMNVFIQIFRNIWQVGIFTVNILKFNNF